MKQPSPHPPKRKRQRPARAFPRILSSKHKPTTEPFTRPRGKPHGPAYPIRRRCPCCGYIVNESKRFTWDHLFQTFQVTFGGRLPGGKGIITYQLIEDPDYLPLMRAQVQRLAERLGVSSQSPRRRGRSP